ncbi:MAG: sensor histidine kinase, partial [Cyanobium sp.]
LPSGGQVVLRLRPAGPRMKMQLRREPDERGEGEAEAAGRSEPVGPVLSWKPDTGSLQLSRQATRQLFHQLGGRLTERGGSSLTVFFPLADTAG